MRFSMSPSFRWPSNRRPEVARRRAPMEISMPDRFSRREFLGGATSLAVSVYAAAAESGQGTFAVVADAVNQKVVKLYGSGGFQSLAAYGTGVLVSPNGHILT